MKCNHIIVDASNVNKNISDAYFDIKETFVVEEDFCGVISCVYELDKNVFIWRLIDAQSSNRMNINISFKHNCYIYCQK